MSRGSLTRFIFDQVGLPTRWLRNNPLWRDSIREMSRHFPPGGAELTVLNVGPYDLTSQLLEYRPDLRIRHLGISTSLPVATNGVDAVTVHSLFHTITDRTSFLHEMLRVLRPGGRLIMLDLVAGQRSPLSILLWQLTNRTRQRFTLEEMSSILSDAGFARVLAERAVNDYAILSRGEKPYTKLSTVQRIAQTAGLDDTNSDLQIVDAAGLTSASRGKFVFLLVRQTPDKPTWAIQPGEKLRWQAAMVSDQEGQPYLLAFTSLSKAVEFMQSAVTTGYLHGINKVAKFDKAVAPKWSADMLLNPPFEMLHNSDHYAVKGITLDVDPASAITGEE